MEMNPTNSRMARRTFLRGSLLAGAAGVTLSGTDGVAQSNASSPGDETKTTEVLYNGITLPKVWPPRDMEPDVHRPMPVPYLQSPPDVIPIDVGRQLFVDDFLIEYTDLELSSQSLAADGTLEIGLAVENTGMQVASLTDETTAKLTAFLPAAASVGNPIDVLEPLSDGLEVLLVKGRGDAVTSTSNVLTVAQRTTGTFNGTTTVTVAAVTAGMGLSFALGSRDIVTAILAGHYLRQSLPEGEAVEAVATGQVDGSDTRHPIMAVDQIITDPLFLSKR